MRNRLALAAMMGLLLAAAGCHLPQWVHNGFKVGPNYCPPAAPVSENWIDSDDPRVLSNPPDCPDWWTVFHDPVLDTLVETAYRQNLTLREAGFRIMQARAQRAIVAGTLLPQAQALNGAYSRSQIGVNAQPHLAPLPNFQRSFDTWSLAADLSWELDIWGRFRRAVEASDANLDASVHEYDAILVSLIAEVATAYTDIRTLEKRLEYARQNIRIQQGSLELTQTRNKEGKTGKISVHLSQSNLDATQALIPQLEIGLRLANNRLCTLLGLPAFDLVAALEEGSGIPTAAPEIAVGIPADLLRRRPDVRAAERLVAAQSARIGVAVSELYPSIAITGEIYVRAEDLSDLFRPLSNGGSIGPSFRWNVLNYGRIVNNVRLQDARLQELVANYQNTVLAANQEVEDALVAFLRTQERVRSLAGTVRETEQALELAKILFEEGATDFTGVFVLQGDLVLKQDQLAAAQGDVVTSLIRVYKALGGGWQIRCRGFQTVRGVPRTPDVMSPEPLPEVQPVLPGNSRFVPGDRSRTEAAS